MHKCPFCQECFWGIRCPQCGRNIRELPEILIADQEKRGREAMSQFHYSLPEQELPSFEFACVDRSDWFVWSYIK
jgi:hypothetical protein